MRKILFVTGTRADYGKLKPLIRVAEDSPYVESSLFVTGMHTLSRYGQTMNELFKNGHEGINIFQNQQYDDGMDIAFANTVTGLSKYVLKNSPDMIVVHGDRVEALAGAVVGAVNGVLVAHIEGGEVSGTIDGVLRHAISKMAHIHLVANDESKNRLLQLGEEESRIYVIGSPEVDVMLSADLPEYEEVVERYNIPFKKEDYYVAIFHPVVGEEEDSHYNVTEFARGMNKSGKNFVVIYPNNDPGSQDIIDGYEYTFLNLPQDSSKRFALYPSLRFEYFLTLLKNSKGIVGNSSTGIREAQVYGLRSVNVGTRQNNRHKSPMIIDADYNHWEIMTAINFIDAIDSLDKKDCIKTFGNGTAAKKFESLIDDDSFWKTSKEKQFVDMVERSAVCPE